MDASSIGDNMGISWDMTDMYLENSSWSWFMINYSGRIVVEYG